MDAAAKAACEFTGMQFKKRSAGKQDDENASDSDDATAVERESQSIPGRAVPMSRFRMAQLRAALRTKLAEPEALGLAWW